MLSTLGGILARIEYVVKTDFDIMEIRGTAILAARMGKMPMPRGLPRPILRQNHHQGMPMEDELPPVPIPITEAFDLHSVQPKEVAEVVEAYLEEAARRGFKSVRIIHGRGRGVQRQIVRAVLARTPGVVGFADAPPELGGWGATVVRLR